MLTRVHKIEKNPGELKAWFSAVKQGVTQELLDYLIVIESYRSVQHSTMILPILCVIGRLPVIRSVIGRLPVFKSVID